MASQVSPCSSRNVSPPSVTLISTVLTASAAVLVLAANAAIVPGATVDGPSADVLAAQTVQSDVAPDGTAAIAYLKGATAHVWVSRLVGGAWSAPDQVESLPGASSNPRVAVANGGKVVVTFANGGNLHGVVKPSASAPFGSASAPYRNHIVTPFILNTATGRYDSARLVYPYLPKNSYYSTFDHISTTTDNRASPLRGTLTRRYGFPLGSPFLNPLYTPNVTSQEVKFTISIFDRAKHQSNEVETTPITIAR